MLFMPAVVFSLPHLKYQVVRKRLEPPLIIRLKDSPVRQIYNPTKKFFNYFYYRTS